MKTSLVVASALAVALGAQIVAQRSAETVPLESLRLTHEAKARVVPDAKSLAAVVSGNVSNAVVSGNVGNAVVSGNVGDAVVSGNVPVVPLDGAVVAEAPPLPQPQVVLASAR